MKIKIGLLALFAVFPLFAGTAGTPTSPSNNAWFGSIGTGYSWTNKPNIKTDPEVWAPSVQGYNASLGNRGFYTFAVGKKVHRNIDLGVSYLNNETFNYQQFQSSPAGVTGTAPRTRYFELNNRAVLVNGYVHPAQHLYDLLGLALTPYAGAGIGYARNNVQKFSTVTGESIVGSDAGSTNFIGNPAARNSLAWQGTLGLDVKPGQSPFSVDLGYRYFGGGKFSGPENVYLNSFGWLNLPAWTGTLTANQVFVEFKYTV